MFFGETPTGLGGSTPQRVEQQPGVPELTTIGRVKCTQILVHSSHISLPKGVPARVDRNREGSTPRFILTTEQTSGCYSVGAYNYRAIYALAPVVVKALNPWSPSKGHRYLHSGPLVSQKYAFLRRLYQIYLRTLNDIKTARTCWTGGDWVITASFQ